MKFVLSRVDYKKHDVVRVWLGPYLVVGLLKPKDIEVPIWIAEGFQINFKRESFQLILGSNEHLEKSREYKLFEPWLGNGLLISKGALSNHT